MVAEPVSRTQAPHSRTMPAASDATEQAVPGAEWPNLLEQAVAPPRAETDTAPVANGSSQEPIAPSPASAEDQLLNILLDNLRGMGVEPQTRSPTMESAPLTTLAGR